MSTKTTTGMITNGNAWGHPHACDAVGPDGKVRRLRLNQSPDTFFSYPGRVNHKGKTLPCFVTCDEGVHSYHFDNDTQRKHAAWFKANGLYTLLTHGQAPEGSIIKTNTHTPVSPDLPDTLLVVKATETTTTVIIHDHDGNPVETDLTAEELADYSVVFRPYAVMEASRS